MARSRRPSKEPYWRVRWLLKGKVLVEAQVQATSEAQAIRVAESSEGKVHRNLRLLADNVEVEKL